MDIKEVLQNLEIVCKGTKFTYEEHMYMQTGLKLIKEKLEELEQLKKPQTEDK